MPKPSLPSHPSDVWEGGFFFESACDVRSVNARGGMVIAGGKDMHLLRPGDQRMMTRPPPLDTGPIRVVAAETRAPRRYAVASETLVAVFYRNAQGDQLMRLRPMPAGPVATHLAWGGTRGPGTLYIRWNDGAVARLKQDMSDLETLDMPPMDALASDDAGRVAMVSFAPEPRAYVTPDGEHMHFRALELGASPSGHVYLALADMAVAISFDDAGVFVSRGEDAPFTRCDALGAGGPIDFEGPATDAALFGAVHQAGEGALVRVDRAGVSMRIAEFGSEGGACPEVSGLGWDASRGRLWAASPQAGLLTSTAPRAKGSKKPMLS